MLIAKFELQCYLRRQIHHLHSKNWKSYTLILVLTPFEEITDPALILHIVCDTSNVTYTTFKK